MGKRKTSPEIEKMTSGRLYNCTDTKVLLAHARALFLCDRFNKTAIWNIPKQNLLIKKLIPNHGKNFFFLKNFHCEYGFNITFGDDVFVNFDCKFMDVAPITIGDKTMFGPNVSLATPVHPLCADERQINDYPSGHHDLEYAKPITIGKSVWIATGVTVLGGVTIGDGAVIGAGSVVTHDIPANCLAAGVPCKVIREIGDDDRIDVWQTYVDGSLPLSKREKLNKQ